MSRKEFMVLIGWMFGASILFGYVAYPPSIFILFAKCVGLLALVMAPIVYFAYRSMGSKDERHD